MSIVYDLKDLDKDPLNNPVLTIGNFDGVHKGHLALFDKVRKLANKNKGQSAVMTFDPHPIKVMKPGRQPPVITLIEQKLELIKEAGIEMILCLPFSREFSSLSAREFVKDVLLERIGIRDLVVGHDYTFGKRRQGNIDLLQNMGSELGFRVHIVDPVYLNDTLISSTNIRRTVHRGDMTKARQMLGRSYRICGTVTSGAGRGSRVLGFPTANLRLIDELIPKIGAYVVLVNLNGKQYQGVCNIGHNPTFGYNELSVETHFLDFSGNLHGKKISIDFICRLRDERTFDSIEALSGQIAKDVKLARELLADYERDNRED